MILRTVRHTRHRLIRGAVLTAVATVSFGLAVWMLLDPGVAGDLATVAGLFIGLISLLLALADFFRQEPARPDPEALADDLALRLREQWLEEAEARQLRDPRVLPLTWTTTARDVADELRSVHSRVLRTRLDGRLDGRFDEVTGRLAEGWAQVPNRRLVAIGEPGSGKTVLAILLTLGLLGVREQGGPLPVLLPVSSWDPVRERLDDWIVRTLAQPYYNGRAEIPRTLLTHGLLLPVLDGLDEIPESARRSAIRGINHAIGGERPVVVTCRAAEYEELIRGGAPTLRRAAVVEIAPVPPEDVVAYLGEAEWPERVDWAPVFARLRAEPDGPVAAALSTPLMATSARLVYQRGGGDPTELLDEERFDCAYAVEDHLTHGLVDAAYAPDPGVPEGAPERWTAEQARRWLTFLACYLHDRRERDLAWWLISGRLLSSWAGPVTGLVLGGVLVVGAAVWMAVTGSISQDSRGLALVLVMGIGGVFALLNSLVWNASEARSPGRLAWSVRGSADRLLRGFRSGAAMALLSAGPLVLGINVVRVTVNPGGQGTPRAVELYVETVTVSAALAVVAGLALAAHNLLDAPPSRATQVSPPKSLAQDRRSALASAGLAGLVVALTGLLGWWSGVVGGDLLLRLLTDWTGWPGNPEVGTLASDRWKTIRRSFGDWQVMVGVTVLLPGTFFALLVLTGRAWPRFVVARFWLALRGRLPWHLMTFLADARRRELLRQAGGVYQFRHIRLQETLAGEPTHREEEPGEREAARRAQVRRRVVLAAAVGVAAAGTAGALSRRRDESVARLAIPGRKPVWQVAMRPGQGRQVAYVLEDGSVWRWSGDEHSPPVAVRKATAEDDYTSVTLAFSGSGSFLAMCDDNGGGVRLQDLRNSRSRFLDLPDPKDHADTSFNLLAFRGDLLACLSGGWIGVWKVPDSGLPTSVAQEPGREGDEYGGMTFLRDGSLAFLSPGGDLRRYPPPGFDTPRGGLPYTTLWGSASDATDSLEYPTYPTYPAPLLASPAEDCIALFGPEGLELWRHNGTAWRHPSWRLGTQFLTGAFHPTLHLLAVTDVYGGDVQLWHTDGPTPVKGKRLTGHNAPVSTLDFTPDGNWLATGGEDGTLRIWDARNLT